MKSPIQKFAGLPEQDQIQLLQFEHQKVSEDSAFTRLIMFLYHELQVSIVESKDTDPEFRLCQALQMAYFIGSIVKELEQNVKD